MYCHRFKKHSNDNELPIRLVTATRGSIQQFDQTLLGKTIKSSSLLFDLEVYVAAENSQSMGQIYNQVIELSRQDPALLVFVHDDVLITDFHWGQTLRSGLRQFDVVGLAGTTRRRPRQPSWCMINAELTEPEDHQYLSGIVAHGQTLPPNNIGVFGPVGRRCQLLDGLFLAVNSQTLNMNHIRFDETFDFHFYDLDFCRQIESKKLTMGTVAISAVHGSTNPYTDNWHQMYRKYLDKWQE